MTEERKTEMNDTAAELKTAKEFLRAQLEKEKRSMKIRLIVGVLVSVIVFGYMFWLSSTLSSLGTPEIIREAFVTTIRSNAPEMVASAKKQILSHKRDLVDFLTKEGAEKLVQVLISEGEKSLDGLVAKITNETMAELNKHFVEVLSKEDSRLRQLLANPDKLHLEEEIVKAFDDDLQASVGQKTFDDDFKEPLSVKYQESLQHLNMINDRLAAMAKSGTLSRREVLMVRFIKSWTAYVQQAGDDVPTSQDRCNDGSRADGIPPQCESGKARVVIGGEWRCVDPGTCQ
jgi:flagellar basal body-associated protein FliL